MNKQKSSSPTATTKKSKRYNFTECFYIAAACLLAIGTLACAGLWLETQLGESPYIKGGVIVAALWLVIEVVHKALKAVRK